jgi:hypothetical protein
MAAFYGLCVALMLVMRVAPETPLGVWLNRGLVEQPLRRLAGLERHHLIFFVMVMLMALAAGEIIAMYGTFEWAMISAFDLSVYIDAMVVTTALGATARLRGAVQALHRGAAWRGQARPVARPRRVRSASKRTSDPPANDDDTAGLPLAA